MDGYEVPHYAVSSTDAEAILSNFASSTKEAVLARERQVLQENEELKSRLARLKREHALEERAADNQSLQIESVSKTLSGLAKHQGGQVSERELRHKLERLREAVAEVTKDTRAFSTSNDRISKVKDLEMEIEAAAKGVAKIRAVYEAFAGNSPETIGLSSQRLENKIRQVEIEAAQLHELGQKGRRDLDRLEAENERLRERERALASSALRAPKAASAGDVELIENLRSKYASQQGMLSLLREASEREEGVLTQWKRRVAAAQEAGDVAAARNAARAEEVRLKGAKERRAKLTEELREAAALKDRVAMENRVALEKLEESTRKVGLAREFVAQLRRDVAAEETRLENRRAQQRTASEQVRLSGIGMIDGSPMDQSHLAAAAAAGGAYGRGGSVSPSRMSSRAGVGGDARVQAMHSQRQLTFQGARREYSQREREVAAAKIQATYRGGVERDRLQRSGKRLPARVEQRRSNAVVASGTRGTAGARRSGSYGQGAGGVAPSSYSYSSSHGQLDQRPSQLRGAGAGLDAGHGGDNGAPSSLTAAAALQRGIVVNLWDQPRALRPRWAAVLARADELAKRPPRQHTDAFKSLLGKAILGDVLTPIPYPSRRVILHIAAPLRGFSAERSALLADVFPYMRILAARLGLSFEFFDPRWGLVEEDPSDDRLSLPLVAAHLERAASLSAGPAVLLLLGDTVGPRLPPKNIAPDVFTGCTRGADLAGKKLLERWYREEGSRQTRTLVPVSSLFPDWIADSAQRRAAQEELQRLAALLARVAKDLRSEALSAEVSGSPFTSEAERALALARAPQQGEPSVTAVLRGIVALENRFARTPKEWEEYLDLDATQPKVQAINKEALATAARLREAAAKALRRDRVLDFTVPELGKTLNPSSAAPGSGGYGAGAGAQGGVAGAGARGYGGYAMGTAGAAAGGLGSGGELEAMYSSAPSGMRPSDDDRYLRRLCDDVCEALSDELLTRFSRANFAEDPLVEEVLAHRAVIARQLESYSGGEEAWRQLDGYIGATHACPLAVFGSSGAGKTALLAHVASATKAMRPSFIVVSRFVGATPRSRHPIELVGSICEQICAAYGRAFSAPRARSELPLALYKCLALASATMPLAVLIDGLDELTPEPTGEIDLAWVPGKLPPHCRLVLSSHTEAQRALATLRGIIRDDNKKHLHFYEVPILAEQEAEDLVKTLAAKRGARNFSPAQRDAIARAARSGGASGGAHNGGTLGSATAAGGSSSSISSSSSGKPRAQDGPSLASFNSTTSVSLGSPTLAARNPAAPNGSVVGGVGAGGAGAAPKKLGDTGSHAPLASSPQLLAAGTQRGFGRLHATLAASIASGWTWTVGQVSSSAPPSLPGTLDALISLCFERAEAAAGPVLVTCVVRALASVRYGLRVSELEDVLSLSDEALTAAYRAQGWAGPAVRRVPPLLVARVLAELRDLVWPSGASAEGELLVFSHRKVRQVAELRYLGSEADRAATLKLLASYFGGPGLTGLGGSDRCAHPHPDFLGVGAPNARKAQELPSLLAKLASYERLATYLSGEAALLELGRSPSGVADLVRWFKLVQRSSSVNCVQLLSRAKGYASLQSLDTAATVLADLGEAGLRAAAMLLTHATTSSIAGAGGTAGFGAGAGAHARARDLPVTNRAWLARALRLSAVQRSVGSRSSLAAAEDHLGLVIEALREREGPRSAALVPFLSEVSLVHQAQGQFGKALSAVNAALANHKDAFGPANEVFAGLLVRLGDVHQAAGSVHEARGAYEEAYGIYESTAGKSSALTAETLVKLGECSLISRNPSDAEARFRHAVDLAEGTSGVWH